MYRRYLGSATNGQIPTSANEVYEARRRAHELCRKSIRSDWPEPERVIVIVDKYLATLTEPEQHCIRHRYTRGRSIEETATFMPSTTKDQVRRLEMEALRKLRHPSRTYIVEPLVGAIRVSWDATFRSA